jgi:hypothetical protein
MAAAATGAPATGSLAISFYDGTRNLVSERTSVLLTLFDGWQHKIVGRRYRQSTVFIRGLSINGHFGDDYRVLASAKGYRDTGFFPARVMAGVMLPVDLMLIPEETNLNFGLATWRALAQSRPGWQELFAAGADSKAAAQRRYSDLADFQQGLTLACILNLTEGMGNIQLPENNALSYLRQIDWSRLAQDRMFGFCTPALLDQVKLAEHHGAFKQAPHTLHPGATCSYKQVQFGEANIQLTFHEHDRVEIGGENCIGLEVDIDYYRDPVAHLVLEVATNKMGSMTDPRQVYVLRWMAGRRAGVPNFDPLYRIEAA